MLLVLTVKQKHSATVSKPFVTWNQRWVQGTGRYNAFGVTPFTLTTTFSVSLWGLKTSCHWTCHGRQGKLSYTLLILQW